MELIYINELGPDFKGQKQYEFIFSEDDEIDDYNWFTVPASSVSESLSPNVNYVNVIGLLKDTDIDLELIQKSDYFGMIDAVDGIIALGWEKYNDEDNSNRLYFKFGDSLKSVIERLLQKNYELKINKIN